jgi:hypothetical protein
MPTFSVVLGLSEGYQTAIVKPFDIILLYPAA